MMALRPHRLVAAAAAGTLGLLSVAPPALAAEPVVEWTRPSLQDSVLEEPGPITGTIRGEEGQEIQDVTFALTDQPVDIPEDPCFAEVTDETSVLDGNSTEAFELTGADYSFPCNGAYELEVTVGYSDNTLTDPLIGAEPIKASIPFSVAIPPAQVEGLEATYDEATKEVRLTWAGNGEADLLGYYIERNPPGPAGFSRLTPELLGPDQTTFTDPGIEDEHRYRVVAVRTGPTDAQHQIAGEPSSSATAGPDRPEPTLPDDIPAPNERPPPRPRGSGDGSGGGGGQRPAPSPSRTRTTSTIFEEALPFDPSQTTTIPPDTDPPADAAVVARVDAEPTDEDRRATLVPIAGGLALVVGAMHLFLLSKRAGEPDIPMRPR